jgi:hypothetical protein
MRGATSRAKGAKGYESRRAPGASPIQREKCFLGRSKDNPAGGIIGDESLVCEPAVIGLYP